MSWGGFGDRLDLDRAAQSFDIGFDDRHAEAGTLFASGARSRRGICGIKKAVDERGLHADPGVADLEGDSVPVARQADRDFTAGPRELDGVAHEIVDHLKGERAGFREDVVGVRPIVVAEAEGDAF